MARKKAVVFQKVLNPFNEGVTYKDFLKALPEGTTPAEYLKGVCSHEQIEWINTELKHLKNKK
tara:strand:- start:554 stop:742 length:189 start_codon:yes stop_codon:yes gene_type:complete